MRRQLLALGVGAGVLAGCGGGGVEGSAAPAERWDPCRITSEAIAATGLDPDSRFEGWGDGVVVDEWGRCVFASEGGIYSAYALIVMSSAEHTIAEARAKPSNREGRDLEVGGRDAFLYRTEKGATFRDCNIALVVPPGVALFTVLYSKDDGVDACEVVQKHVLDLEGALPSAPE